MSLIWCLNLSLSWIMTKVPVFGRLIVEHDITTLDLLYARVFRQSIIFLFLLVILSTICLFLFTAFGFEIANRFVPAPLFFILSLTAIGNHIVACQATYVRSHKVEKYLLNAVITACSMAVMFWFVRDFDKNVMIISYLLIIWFICVPHSIYTIFKFRNGDKWEMCYCQSAYQHITDAFIWKRLLDSIIPQVVKNASLVEICITDNASTDDTFTLCSDYSARYSFIKYIWQNENRGPDVNIHAAYSLASGRYVWIFGDDDYLRVGALGKILDILSNK